MDVATIVARYRALVIVDSATNLENTKKLTNDLFFIFACSQDVPEFLKKEEPQA
jgi:hypothetical protein